MSKFAPHKPSSSNPRATSSTVCQKCLGTGHYTFQCKNSRPYLSRPSRTEQLEKPQLLAKLKANGKPSVEVPEEFRTKSGTANKILEAKEKERTKGKEPERKRARRSSSPQARILTPHQAAGRLHAREIEIGSDVSLGNAVVVVTANVAAGGLSLRTKGAEAQGDSFEAEIDVVFGLYHMCETEAANIRMSIDRAGK
ncbi:zinc knuckle-domain-containing protein [Cristinia sonorae]|uniref:Zinc knuckle-domain-containing protein n=1 Tax=Cristinia sonorae TaxID=1940300 RepID=A0A8K0UVH2_9AGAR|nr:zinc knuckle-domain-containing protein [Cristinia sonorae]